MSLIRRGPKVHFLSYSVCILITMVFLIKGINKCINKFKNKIYELKIQAEYKYTTIKHNMLILFPHKKVSCK